MRSILANIIDNPILMRELRRRMRGKALVYSIITYIMMMTISTVFVLLITSPSPFAEASQRMLDAMRLTGERIFLWITGIQMLLVLVVAPTITAGMTTGEKERKTFDFLRVTTITRWMYVIGCFLSTAFYVGLALLCALPLLSLVFLYGGANLNSVISMFFHLLGASCILSSFGLFVSSVCERTRTAQGIIVFLIFGLVFGGFLLYTQISVLFAGATAAAGGPTVSGVLYVYGAAIPSWIMTVVGMVAISSVLLLLAARKLFEPEDVRAFAHWQYVVLLAGFLATFAGFLAGNAFTSEIPEVAFLLMGYLLLIVAVQTFAIGRMEVGDEIWHLKRLLPILRPIDQTIPFLVLVAAIWYFAVSGLPRMLPAMILPRGAIDAMVLVSICSFAFFCFVARATTALTSVRTKAGGYSIAVMVFFLLVVPILGFAIGGLAPGLADVSREIIAVSPMALLYDAFRNSAPYAAGGGTIGTYAAGMYIVLAIGVAAWGETKRFLKYRGFDYHYDMPVG